MSVLAAVCQAGLVIWVAFEFTLRNKSRAASTWKAGDGDRGSTYLIFGAYVVCAVLLLVLQGFGVGELPLLWRWVGVGVLGVGLCVRAWSMTTLAGSYTRTLRAQENQELVTGGPYRFVRHPGYTGSLLVWGGYACGVGNGLSLVGVAVVLGVVYAWRIRAEEEMLVQVFGEKYQAYCGGTKRLIPFVY